MCNKLPANLATKHTQKTVIISWSFWGFRIWKWLSWVTLAQGLTRLQGRCLLGPQSSDDLQEQKELLLKWLSHRAGTLGLSARSLSFSPHWPQHRAAWVSSQHGCLFPQDKFSKREREAESLMPSMASLQSHTLPFPQCTTGYTGYPCSVWEGNEEARTLEVGHHLGGWLPHLSNVFISQIRGNYTLMLLWGINKKMHVLCLALSKAYPLSLGFRPTFIWGRLKQQGTLSLSTTERVWKVGEAQPE